MGQGECCAHGAGLTGDWRSRGQDRQANGGAYRELFVSTEGCRRSAEDAALAPMAHVIKYGTPVQMRHASHEQEGREDVSTERTRTSLAPGQWPGQCTIG